MSLNPGDSFTLSVKFVWQNQYTTPNTVTLNLFNPVGTLTTYTLADDPSIISYDGNPGEFTASFQIPDELDSVGTWTFEWVGATTTWEVKETGNFLVVADPIIVTITVEDQDDSSPVPQALVSIVDSSGVIKDQLSTNSTGQVSSNVVPGTYTIKVTKPGWQFSDSSVSFSSGTTTLTVQGTDLGITVTPTINTCRVYGFLLWADGSVIINDNFVLLDVLRKDNFVATGGTGLNPDSVGVGSRTLAIKSREADGFWEIDLVQNSIVHLRIPVLEFSLKFRVPAQTSINLADIRPEVPAYRAGI